MNLPAEFVRINRLILNGQADRARSELNQIKPRGHTEKRIWQHHDAMIEFSEGKIDQALVIIDSALKNFGENVNLVRDKAVCHFHLSEMNDFRRELDRLERLLLEHDETLSKRSKLECELVLGKFLEEEARLAPAELHYRNALLRTESTPQRLRVLVQLARWQALYEPSAELSVLYQEILSLRAGDFSQDLAIEVEHSLLLIELKLVGAGHAWQRYLNLPAGTDEMDRRLLLFDFVEGSLQYDLEIKPTVLELIRNYQNLDRYEEAIRILALERSSVRLGLHQLMSISAHVPWASYLRLLCLTASLTEDSSTRAELHRKVQLLIQGLDPRSRQLWSKRLKSGLQVPQIQLEFSPHSRVAHVQNQPIDLSKKKFAQLLLPLLKSQATISVDQAIHGLWQAEFSPEHYHRLRMGIFRLNNLIHDQTGIGKIIEVDSQEVRLRPEVRLIVHESSEEDLRL
ncbi:MAG: hypothetical protein AB7F86_00465 [Bdellovibrionales bacterium]